MNNDLVYVAHNYGGRSENLERVEKIISALVSSKLKYDYTFVSPLHTFGFLYDKTTYNEGFMFCRDLLFVANELWLCYGDLSTNSWTTSIGCNREYGIALGRKIPIKYIVLEDDTINVYNSIDRVVPQYTVSIKE